MVGRNSTELQIQYMLTAYNNPFLKMFRWQKLDIITNNIPALCTLKWNVKDSIVRSGFWGSLNHSRRKPQNLLAEDDFDICT